MNRVAPWLEGRTTWRNRRGATLIELTAAMSLVAAAATLTFELAARAVLTRQEAREHQWAVQETANTMQRIMVQPYADITTQQLAAWRPSAAAAEVLRGAELSAEVTEQTAPPSKRIVVRLRWHDRRGQWNRPVQLIGWIHRGGRS